MKVRENQEIIKKQQEMIKKQREESSSTLPAKNFKEALKQDKNKEDLNKQKTTEEKTLKPMKGERIVNIIRNRKVQAVTIATFAFLIITILIGLVMEILTLNFSYNIFHMIYLTLTNKISLIISLVVLGVLGLFVYLTIHNKTEEEDNFKISDRDTYGSSDRGDVYSEEAADNIQIGDTFEEMEDMVFGYDDNNKFVGLNKDTSLVRNTYIVGQPGAGKTTGFIHNQILQLIKMQKSIVITDPKGELRRDTYHLLKDNGYIVKELNFKNLIASDSWDMLGDAGIDNVDYLIDVIIRNTSPGGATEFDNAEGNLLTALCLYVLNYKEKTRAEIWQEYYKKIKNGEHPNLEEYQSMAEECPVKDRTFGAAYNLLLENSDTELDMLFLGLNKDDSARLPYNTFLSSGSESKYKKNIMMGLSTRLRLFRRDIIQKVMGIKDIETTLPVKEKCAYFCIFPDQDQSYSMLSALFIEFLIKNIVEYVDNHTGENLKKVHFLLDEFLLAGTFNNFSTTLAGARGRGIEVTMITQSLSQMRNKYPNDVWANIIGCCDIQIILGSNDELTENYYSAKSGEATIEVINTKNVNDESIMSSGSIDVGQTTGEGKRMVYTPAEIRKIRKRTPDAPLGDIIVFLSGDDSYKLHKYPSFINETFKKYTTKQEQAIEHIPMWLENLARFTNYGSRKDGIYTIISEDKRTPALNRLIEKKEKEYTKYIIKNTINKILEKGYTISKKQGKDEIIYVIDEKNFKISFKYLIETKNLRTIEKLKNYIFERIGESSNKPKENKNPKKEDKKQNTVRIPNNKPNKPNNYKPNNQNNNQNKKSQNNNITIPKV